LPERCSITFVSGHEKHYSEAWILSRQLQEILTLSVGGSQLMTQFTRACLRWTTGTRGRAHCMNTVITSSGKTTIDPSSAASLTLLPPNFKYLSSLIFIFVRVLHVLQHILILKIIKQIML
jgi:hypothetical protein